MYIDIIDAYEYWGDSNKYADGGEQSVSSSKKEAAERMISFVQTLSVVAKEQDPDFLIVPQNGEELAKFNNGRYLDFIDGIGVEDIWFNGNKKVTKQ